MTRTGRTTIASTLAVCLAAAAALAWAGAEAGGAPRVRHEVLTTSRAAASDGGLGIDLGPPAWRGAMTSADGGLRLEGSAMLYVDSDRWFPSAGNPEGWALEARLRPPRTKGPCAEANPALFIEAWDGQASVMMSVVLPDEVGLSTGRGPGVKAKVSPSSAARTYRLERRGARAAVEVDGREVLAAAIPPEHPLVAGVPVVFGATQCLSLVSEWEMVAWETAPRPVPAGLDPSRIHPASEPERVLEAIAAGLPAEERAAVQALRLSPAALACAARTVLDDAIRLGARRAFEAEALAGPPSRPEPAPAASPALDPKGCPAQQMPAPEVTARAQRAAKVLAQLSSTLDVDAMARARNALSAPPARGPRQMGKGPACEPGFPFPPEVGSATHAADLEDRWPHHPQNLYVAMTAAASALSAPGDRAALLEHLRAVAAGRGKCPATRP